jgi:hypothetical protein
MLTKSLEITGWNVKRADVDRGQTIYKIYEVTHPELSK